MTGRKHSEPKIAENDAGVFCCALACDASRQLYGRSGAKENKELLADESRGG
jgi:hypothetical protein